MSEAAGGDGVRRRPRAADPHKVPIDPNGNLTQKTDGADTWAYEWNANNELTKVEKNGVEQARFAYDPLGRRVEKVAGGATATFTYDRASILRQVQGGTTLKYVHGFRIDEPLAADEGAAMSYVHADTFGTVMKMTDAAGAVTLTRQYDSWGNLETGAGEHGYAYTGREWDPEVGLYYYRARYYSASLGRFISEDPSGFDNDINVYQYVFSNPTKWIDPTGEGAAAPTPTPTPLPVPCRFGSFGGPAGCMRLPPPKQEAPCPGKCVSPQKPACRSYFHRDVQLACLAISQGNAGAYMPPLPWQASMGQNIVYCTESATFCDETGPTMIPDWGPECFINLPATGPQPRKGNPTPPRFR